MDKEYASFLLQCDEKMNITNTFWYRPVYLISPYQRNLLDLFSDSDKNKVEDVVLKAFTKDEILSFEGLVKLASPDVDIALCVMASGDKLLVHGIQFSVLGDKENADVVKDLVHGFMKVIKDSDTELITENETMIRYQFEQIQKLNNELLNMQRQVKKANSKLNKLNKDLSNRLVKDALTGLVSRYQYREEIELTIGGSPEKQGIFTFLDIDDFKGINDTLGHRAGDDFLKEFAARLLKLPFENMICMRIAGDEFGLYIHGYETVTEEDIAEIWTQIKKLVLSAPIILESGERAINCSAGMSVYGKDTVDIYDLIEYADFAMYEAKNSGKNSYSQFNSDRYGTKKISIL